jgi:hypothetical protein
VQKGLKRDQEREVRAHQDFMDMRNKLLFSFPSTLHIHSIGERREEEARGGGQAAELRVSERGLWCGEGGT